MEILGIDIGGSGIKGAPVETENGQLIAERLRFATPQPSTPQAIAKVVKQIISEFKWNGRVGCGFPAVVRDGVVRTAANIDSKWIGTPINKLFSDKCGLKFNVINDADAAGLAEIKFGSGKNRKGVVFIITVGTGIGSAIFVDGKLVPNTELGHMLLKEGEAEQFTSDAVRKKEELSWPKWAKRFNKYLQHLEMLFWPDLIIIGGGVSKKKDKFIEHIQLNCEVVEAKLLNHAGIIGAALAVDINE
jgi:polyphosphate glucokinase